MSVNVTVTRNKWRY